MRKTFHIAAGCRFLSVRPRGVELALIKVLKPRASMRSLGACLRGFGTRLALFTGGGTQRMSSRASKTLMLLLSLASLTFAFIERHSSNAPLSLLLFGMGMISLASFSRRHIMDQS